MTLLVVAKAMDRTADYAVRRMEARGLSYARLDSDRFGEANIELHFPESSPSGLILENKHVRLADIQAVWLRRLVKPGADHISAPEPRRFAEQELDFTLRWLIDILDYRCPVVDPERTFASGQNKFGQLAIAPKLGLMSPATLITNNPQTAKDFVKQYHHVALKSVAGYGRKVPGGFYAAYTRLVTPEIVAKFDSLGLAPVCLQEYIPKAFELRITVIGANIFGCRIDSQETERTRIDWRRYDASTPHSIYAINSQLGDKLLGMMRRYELRFASFDFIVTPDGREIFLEMNPASQYLWIEELTGMPITDAIIDELLRLSETAREYPFDSGRDGRCFNGAFRHETGYL